MITKNINSFFHDISLVFSLVYYKFKSQNYI